MPSQEIKLAPTNELVDELRTRFEHFIIGGIKTNIHSQTDMVTIRRWKGNYTLCTGLCSEIADEMFKASAQFVYQFICRSKFYLLRGHIIPFLLSSATLIRRSRPFEVLCGIPWALRYACLCQRFFRPLVRLY